MLLGCWGALHLKNSTLMRLPATVCSPPARKMLLTLVASFMTTNAMLPGRSRDLVASGRLEPRCCATLECVTSTLLTWPKPE